MRICLLTARVPPVRCGVGDYSVQLGNYFVSRGDEVVLLTTREQSSSVSGACFAVRSALPSWKLKGMRALWREIHAIRPDVILVQWVPYLYSRTGTNLVFPLTIAALAAKGLRIQVVVHEPWVAFGPWSSFVTGPIHRLALGILVTASKKVSVSIEKWRDLLRSRFPWKKSAIDCVPVGSNIPVTQSGARMSTRRSAGIKDDAVAMGIFSLHGSGKAFSFVEAAHRDLAERGDRFRMVVIGATAEEAALALPETARDVRCQVTGYLSAEEISKWLQAVDVLLAPFVDGVSGRRGTVLAGLAHGLPVVTTRGRLTDRLFDSSPLVLSDANPAAFSQEVLSLVQDPRRRAEMATEARAFFDAHFSWQRVGEAILPAPGKQPCGSS